MKKKKIDIKTGIAAGFLLLLVVAGFGIQFLPVDVNYFDPLTITQPEAPSWRHPFGTDDLGREL